MHLVGCKDRLASLEVEPHSAIAQVEMLVRRIHLGTEQRFATPAVERLKQPARAVEIRRLDRQVAATWARQVRREIRLLSEMPAAARLDRLATMGIEQHFGMALGERRDLQVVIGGRDLFSRVFGIIQFMKRATASRIDARQVSLLVIGDLLG